MTFLKIANYVRSKLIKQFDKNKPIETIEEKLRNELSTWINLCEEKDLLCKQIYHDLASPLGLLKISTQRLGDQNIAKPFALSLDRLMKISENLQNRKYIWACENPKLEPLKNILEAVAEKKRLLTSQMKIQFEIRANAKTLAQIPDVPAVQLHRIFSIILNSMIKSAQPIGDIKLMARHTENNQNLNLVMTGSSIFFTKGDEFNYLRLCIESFGGELSLLRTDIKRNHGTAILIRLPITK